MTLMFDGSDDGTSSAQLEELELVGPCWESSEVEKNKRTNNT
jgi:hypothetical protein